MSPLISVMLILGCSLAASAADLKDLFEDSTPASPSPSSSTFTPPYSTLSREPTKATPIKSDAYVVSASVALDPDVAILASKAPPKKISLNTPALVPHPPPAMKASSKYFNKSQPKKRKSADVSSIPIDDTNLDWKCPNITGSRSLECGCDLPHTLRCNGDLHGLTILAERLRKSPYTVSLLDCSLRNVTYLSDAKIFNGISLHGLVISSGEMKRVHKSAFLGINGPLQALGLPGNALISVPWSSINSLTGLERLDLSNNRIKALGSSDFAGLSNLVYLDLGNNQISSISQRTFGNLRKLEILKLEGNRLGDYPASLNAISQCFNLRELDLTSNNLNGPLTGSLLPSVRNLEVLNLNRNLIKSIQNKAMQNFSRLTTLSMRHNQIDVLQDHAFYGLGSLDSLDLSYNGIVAISSASLQHLTRLTKLDLTHNFLRALTSDLITPLPSLHELRLAGNDISIVAKNAMDGARELKSLSLQDNPLSCDCTIRSFAEWLQVAKISPQDMLSATCITPMRLEGAPLIQVPVESLSCEMDNLDKDNANIIEHLESINRQNESTHIKDLSEEIILHELHYSTDYGLILTWVLNLSKNDFMCDAIFVYKEENINEILIDNSPIHCESKIINGQNTVSVIVPDSSELNIGESYRFCLVMVQEKNPKADLNVGCSNITKLELSTPGDKQEMRQYHRRQYYTSEDLPLATNKVDDEFHLTSGRSFNALGQHKSETGGGDVKIASRSFDFLDSFNKSFLPGLGLGILVTTIVVLLFVVARIHQNLSENSRPTTPTATCYAASEHIARLADAENGARYLKLQATTSL